MTAGGAPAGRIVMTSPNATEQAVSQSTAKIVEGYDVVKAIEKIGSASHLVIWSSTSISLQSGKPQLNVKYVPKTPGGIPKTVTSKKNQPPKASELPSSSSGSENGKNDGTYAKEKVTSLYDSSNIPVSNPYACLDEESEEEVENVFNESAKLLSSAKLGASSFPRAGEAA
ncbi:hypothetical protein Tco_0782044 [Tanacetum coccineum]